MESKKDKGAPESVTIFNKVCQGRPASHGKMYRYSLESLGIDVVIYSETSWSDAYAVVESAGYDSEGETSVFADARDSDEFERGAKLPWAIEWAERNMKEAVAVAVIELGGKVEWKP